MSYGISADRKLVTQFQRILELSGCKDLKFMTKAASENIVNLFWNTDWELKQYDLETFEERVFQKLVNKKRGTILVDGAHVEAYFREMAHEITKVKRSDPNIDRDHPYVTICKANLERIVREMKILIKDKLCDETVEPKTKKKTKENKEEERGEDKRDHVNLQHHSQIRKGDYYIRKHTPIVTAKREYGNYN